MKTITLSNGVIAQVDADDFDELSQYAWHQDTKGYAYRQQRCGGGKRITTRMHRHIMSDVKVRIDHENRNLLDNRRSNLRPATASQNQYNRVASKISTSGYKGVYWKKSHAKWLASIGFNRKQRYLGLFDSPEDAAQAYNSAAIELHGQFARINILKRQEENS